MITHVVDFDDQKIRFALNWAGIGLHRMAVWKDHNMVEFELSDNQINQLIELLEFVTK